MQKRSTRWAPDTTTLNPAKWSWFQLVGFVVLMISGCNSYHVNPDCPAEYPPKPVFPGALSREERDSSFGAIRYQIAVGQRIFITNDWVNRNLDTVYVPQLVAIERRDRSYDPSPPGHAVHDGNVRVHRKIKQQFLMLWQAWEDAGILEDVKYWSGMYNPRLMSNSDALSSHAFAIAFDINSLENKFGEEPACRGENGSVFRLVPIAIEHGFAWGGHWTGRKDGMHFEAVKIMSPSEKEMLSRTDYSTYNYEAYLTRLRLYKKNE